MSSVSACTAEMDAGDGDGDGSGSGAGSGSGSGSGSATSCTDPFTGDTVPEGGSIQSYTTATAADANACAAAQVTSTCTAGQLLPPPASAAACLGEPEPPAGLGYYFSDCQAGAQTGCVPGDNANPGTSPAAPKRNLDGFSINTLPAGAHIVFARGGAWTNQWFVVNNYNATTQAPLVFGSYAPSWGGTARPIIRIDQARPALFEFGRYNDTFDDGGYIVRNLVIDGAGDPNSWGFWLRDRLHDLTIENVEITGFAIGINAQSETGDGINRLIMRGSNIHHNSAMGFLGDIHNSLLENNLFRENNFSGSGFNHAIYFGGQGTNTVVRNNQFQNNSIVNGTCTGGNVTVHGVWDNLLLEGNTISQVTSSGGCYGFSLNPGYASAESMTNFVVRGNTIVNLGNCAVCASGTPGLVVENNLVVQTNAQYHAAIIIGQGDLSPDDTADGGAIVRNNTVYMSNTTAGAGIRVNDAGSEVQVVSNLVYLAVGVSDNTACFQHGAPSNYTAFDYNLCYRASSGPWSDLYATLAAAQSAGMDTHSRTADPGFTMLPTATSWSCQLAAGSPAVDAGHPTMSSSTAFGYGARTVADIGACER